VDTGGGSLRRLSPMRRGRSRGWRRVGAGAVLAAALGLALGAGWSATPVPPAGAQESLIDSDPAVVKARADLEAAQAAAHDAAAKLEATTEQRDAVVAKIDDDRAHIAALEEQRAALARLRDELLDHLRQRAVALYSMGGDGASAADIFSGSVLQGARRKQLGDAASRSDHDNATRLEQARSTLADTQDTLRREQDDLQAQQNSLDGLLADLQQQQAAVDQRVAEANAALEHARVIGALHAANDPVMGPATLTADQMVGWFNAQGYHPRLGDTSVPELAQIFLEEGGAENVRGDFAFAQAIVETGGFASAPDNNYSGLGWCDTCARGTVFPTPRDGIRAQIQLLLNYADATSTSAALHNPPSPYWWGPNAAQAFDTYFAKGWAPTWHDMGHGNWATDPNYAGKVISIYNSMVAFSQGG
jgi:peptidoglycan hydrolase CwlO-like protein